jgi:hypothetical protein
MSWRKAIPPSKQAGASTGRVTTHICGCATTPGAPIYAGRDAVKYGEPNFGQPNEDELRKEQAEHDALVLSIREGIAELKADLVRQRREEELEFKRLSELRWQRFLKKAKAIFDERRTKAGFDPNQLRVPAGHPDGGQWTDADGGSTELSVLSDAGSALIDFGVQLAADGHHYIPVGVFEKEKYSFTADTLQVLRTAKTGPLHDPTSNKYDKMHREYNKAVEEHLDDFLKRNNMRGDQMNPDQARSFVAEIKTSRDPRVRKFNMRLWMREINYWLRLGPRGRE